MQASVLRIDEFISDKRTLVIPVYQRNYDWKTANCERLFDDIEFIAENNNEHFIGTFVYQHNPAAGIFQEFIIIDGQQRITSIILFVKAIYDLTDNSDLKEDIHSTFIKHSKGELKNKCKLRPTYDCNVFEKLMRDKTFDENDFDVDEKSSAMYKNYLFFCEKISKSSLDAQKLYNAIYKLKVVSILLQDENPQEIFESLNSTGLDLSKADLIRNFLLMPLSYDLQEELYKNYWLEIEKLLRPSGNVENFLIQYLITKRRSDTVMETKKQRLSPRNLYDMFKKFFNANFTDAESCLKDMYRYAKFFRRFIFNEDTNCDKLPALDKKFYELIYRLDAANAPIILMYLLEQNDKKPFDEETFINFIDALISLTFRAKVCGNTGITAQFAGNVIARLDKENFLDTKTFWRVVTFGKGRYAFPNDNDFQAALVNNNLYETIKSNGCKYLLYSLERKSHAKELPSYSEATLEHILPQKLNAGWKNYLATHNDSSAHEILLHTLGNLALTAYNSELGNSDFEHKKKIYAQSNYFYTQVLSEYNEWTSTQILTRAKKLADVAIKIWTLPEEFKTKFANRDVPFDLDSDFEAFKGTKPAALFIADTEVKMQHWSHLLREIVRQLYALDKDTFRQATQLKNVRQSLFSTDPTDFKIDDDFYMATGFDTESCLKILKTLVENFDRLGGTSLKEDICFTLSQK